MSMLPAHKRLPLILGLVYTLSFMGGSIYTGFASLYWTELSLDPSAIGILNALAAAAALAFQPWWGHAGDQARSKTRILQLSLLVSTALIWSIPAAGSQLWYLIPAVMAFTAMNNSVGPMADTISLELARTHGFSFGPIRMAGSLGFAAMSALAGVLLAGRLGSMFLVFSLARIGALAASLAIPPVAGHGRTSATPVPYRDLFRDRSLVLMYGLALVLSAAWAFMLNFHAIHSTARGVGLETVGFCIGLGSIAQFPFMAGFTRLERRFGIRRLLMFAGLMYGVRMLLLAWFISPWTIVPIWLLHGTNFILVYLCLAEYVHRNSPPALQARGQMANALVLGSLGAIPGTLFGGMAASAWGLSWTFTGFGILCAAATIAYAIVSSRSLERATMEG